MRIELLDSRRLTGPNLFGNLPGAVLDITIDGIPADEVISAWTFEVSQLMEALGWSGENTCSRVYTGGASLVINAAIDVLYTACEINELAFDRAVAILSGEALAYPRDAIAALSLQAADESKP